MDRRPEISPDGAYWWDGQAWQLMPGYAPPVAALASAADSARPAWLPETAVVPSSPEPPGLPLISPPALVGAYTPVWAATPTVIPPPTPLSPMKQILTWGGLGLGAVLLLFGLIAIPASVAQIGDARTGGLAIAALLIVLGGFLLAPCLLILLGFVPVVSATFHSLGILGCIVVFGMVVNTAFAVMSPVGSGRWALPWGTVALVVFRALRGRWLGAGIITIVWAIGGLVTLTMSHA